MMEDSTMDADAALCDAVCDRRFEKGWWFQPCREHPKRYDWDPL